MPQQIRFVRKFYHQQIQPANSTSQLNQPTQPANSTSQLNQPTQPANSAVH
ncbi:hypothetical protein H6G72_14860 [Planktothricoides sp. FACHB-1370]|uniref:Uncharacterized protein n=2 Tax=Planktothricoides raciborskii TaxID=132608 RepID=A0AAU8JCH3_9CYAN|nr:MULTISPECIES: hypothetical protein [Planktothricoides]MBD2545093.1 hypothetical protein [Planktothricoides raciborskii FACHB-1370]MBD2584251.1 hypothetical protein [Planktothricoides raciborskii FACHB-1261]